MTCGIYGIRNLVNGKWYIGQSTQIEARKRIHICLLRQGRHYSNHLQKAFDLYGLESFEWRNLEEVSVELLDVRECAWIRYYHSDHREFGYNLTGGGGQYRQVSLETREKLSRPRSAEARKNMSEARKRSPLAKAQIKAVQLANIGRKKSVEECLKLSVAHKKRGISPEHRQKMVAGIRSSSKVQKHIQCLAEAHRGTKFRNGKYY